ncbi:unnamed protein product [Cunninghamella blakesleeana]
MVPYKIAFAVSLLLYNTICQGSAFVYEDFLAYPKYNVDFTNKKIPESNIFGDQLKNTQQVGWWNAKVEQYDHQKQIVMMNKVGQPFLCTIPKVTPEEDEKENIKYKEATSAESSLIEKQHTIEYGLKLLQPLQDKECLYYGIPNTYWTYEYCHMRYVRQFHIDPTKTDNNEQYIIDSKNTYILGTFPEPKQSSSNKPTTNNEKRDTTVHINTNKNNEQSLSQNNKNDQSSSSYVRGLKYTTLKNMGDKKLLVQRWGGGTLCDKTNQPRMTDIQFQCDMHIIGDQITNYQEISTCHYLMTISTPRLCDDNMLTSHKKPKVHQIECNPIVPDNEPINENNLLHENEQREHSILNNKIEQQEKNIDTDTNQQSTNDEVDMVKKIISEQFFGNKEEKESTTTTTTTTQEELNNMNTNDLIDMINRLSKQMDELKQQQEQLQQQKPLQAEIHQIYTINENGQLEMVNDDKLLPKTANSEITKAAQALVSQLFMSSKQTNPSTNNNKHEQRKKTPVKESETQQQNKKMYEKNYYHTENNQ